MIKLQGAAEHGPDRFNAFATYRASDKTRSSAIVKAVAGLLTQVEAIELTQGGTLHVLVAIAPQHLSDHDAAEAIDEHWSPKTEKQLIAKAPAMVEKVAKDDGQADVFVQVVASLEDDRVFALRLAHGILSQGSLELVRECFGTPQLVRRDPFGFRAAASNPWTADPETDRSRDRIECRIESGALEGATWLLLRHYVQDVEAFIKLDSGQRERVVGIKTDGTDLPPSTPRKDLEKSHVGIARRYQKEGRGQLVRRGFYFRESGEEGLAFIALAQGLDAFIQADDEMEGSDGILKFVTAMGGGIYLVPPSAEWLLAGVRPSAVPPAAKEIQRYEAPLELMEVTPAMRDYLRLLRQHGAFVGEIGQQQPLPEVAQLLRKAHAALAKESSAKDWEEIAAQLDTALSDALKASNKVNDQAGEYITVSY